MGRARDTYRYTLRDGRDVVMYGVTDDPEARLAEHQRNRRNVTMTVNGPVRDQGVCFSLGTDSNRTVLPRAHDGKKPRYNKV